MKTEPLRLHGLPNTLLTESDAETTTGNATDAFSTLLQRAPLPRPPSPAPPPPDVTQTRHAIASPPSATPATPRSDLPSDKRPDRASERPTRAEPARHDNGNARPAASEPAESSTKQAPPRKPSNDAPANDSNTTTSNTAANESPPPAQDDEDTTSSDAPWPPSALGGLEVVLAANAPVAQVQGGAIAASSATVSAGPPAQPLAAAFANTASSVDGTAALSPSTTAANAPLIETMTSATGLDAARNASTAATLFALPATANAALSTPVNADSLVFDGAPTPPPDLLDGFDDAVGARLSWLAEHRIGHAHIKLNPDDLGPIEVHLRLEGDNVNASFSSAHVEVRQALEQSLPRLRELLGQQGFQLTQADVGGQFSQGQQPASTRGVAEDAAGGAGETGSDGGIPTATLRRRGILDAYA